MPDTPMLSTKYAIQSRLAFMSAEDGNDDAWMVGNGLTPTSANWAYFLIRQGVLTQ